MKSKTLFIDTKNLNLDSYERSTGKLQLQNIDPGIGSIKTIALTYIKIANYLLYYNRLRFVLDVGDTDDKMQISRNNSQFAQQSVYATIPLTQNIESKKYIFNRDDEMLTDTNYLLSNDNKHVLVLPDENLLHSMTISMSDIISSLDYHLYSDTGSALSIDTTEYTFIPSVRYEISIDGTIEIDFDADCTYDVDTKNAFSSSLKVEETITNPSGHPHFETRYSFTLPLMFFESTKFLFILKDDHGATMSTVKHSFDKDASMCASVGIRKNSQDFCRYKCRLYANSYASTVSCLPTFIERSANVLFDGSHSSLKRLTKGDNVVLFASLEKYVYNKSSKLLSPDITKYSKFTVTLLMDVVHFTSIDMSQLDFTYPTAENQIKSNSLNMKFVDIENNPYPIMTHDDFFMALKFEANEF